MRFTRHYCYHCQLMEEEILECLVVYNPHNFGCNARPYSPPAKLDSDKFGNSTADQTCWLD